MLKRLFGDLPTWASPDNPLLRYELTRYLSSATPAARAIRVTGWVIVLSALLLAGYLYVTNGATEPLQRPYTQEIWLMLFFPLLLLQTVLRVAGLSLGVGVVHDARRRQTWDNLRSTERGAEIGLRTRWFAILLRLRGLLLTVLVGRIVLVLALLYDLTNFQGDYLNLLTARSLPALPLELGVVIVSATMTAVLLMPITATGVDAALGLLISSAINNRALAGVLQVIVAAFRILSTAILWWLAWTVLFGERTLDSTQALLSYGGFAWLGDWGLLLTRLNLSGEIWTAVPYSVFAGIFLLLMVVLQTAIINAILWFATYLAEHRG